MVNVYDVSGGGLGSNGDGNVGLHQSTSHPRVLAEQTQVGPAQACGLICVGDVLVAVDGDRVRGMSFSQTLCELLSLHEPVSPVCLPASVRVCARETIVYSE